MPEALGNSLSVRNERRLQGPGHAELRLLELQNTDSGSSKDRRLLLCRAQGFRVSGAQE